jgi:hypothetical protein
VAAELVDLLVVNRELVAGGHLPRQAQRGAVDVLIVNTLLARDAARLAIRLRRTLRDVEGVGDRRMHAA